MLADYAVVADGKLYVSGGGWSLTGPDPVPAAIALKLDVPWDLANTQISFSLRLLQEDGHPVTIAGPEGDQPVRIEGGFEVGRPPGLRQGQPIDVPMAFPVGPLPLEPGRRFSWELMVNGVTHEEWHLSFGTRPAGQR